jgi:alpha-L-fucosidase
MAKSGNYLLNVGPQADGTFPDKSLLIISKIGKWYQAAKEAFENIDPFPLDGNKGKTLCGRRENVVYVYLHDSPRKTGIILNPINILPKKATVLNNGKILNAAVEQMPSLYPDKKEYLHIWNIPVDELANEAIILKLEFDDAPLDKLMEGQII